MFSNGQFVRIYREEHSAGIRALSQLSAVLALLSKGSLPAEEQQSIAALAGDLTHTALDAFSAPSKR